MQPFTTSSLARGPILFIGTFTVLDKDGKNASDPASYRICLALVAIRAATSGAFPAAFPALRTQATIVTVPESLPASPSKKQLRLALADGGIRDNLGLRLLEDANRISREDQVGSRSIGWNGFTPDPDWKLNAVIVSDGGAFLQGAEILGVISSVMRAIDLASLETGPLRPIEQSDKFPRILLSSLATIAHSPDAAIFGMSLESVRNADYGYFRPACYSDLDLKRIVDLVPDNEARERALQAYVRSRGDRPVDRTGLRRRCNGNEKGSSDCAWWALVSLVGEDIWRVASVFMKTPTLEDAFTATDIEEIFRFGTPIRVDA